MLLAPLLDPRVVSFEAPPESLDQPDALFDAEREALSGCARTRVQQYTASRILARRAFAELGLGPAALLNHPDRSPLWPPGYVGSLSHTRQLCAVAVAPSRAIRALGIDVELSEALSPGLLRRVLLETEIAHLTSVAEHSGESLLTLAKLAFSAKESVYKCQYPLTQTFLGFHDVECEFDWSAGTFWAAIRVRLDALPTGSDDNGRALLQGRFARGLGHWATAVVLS